MNKPAAPKSPKKSVGKVAPAERDEIRRLHERKNALVELLKSLSTDEEVNALYERLIGDLGAVTTAYHDWWNLKSRKYQWENIPGAKWEIDFETCEIFLVAG